MRIETIAVIAARAEVPPPVGGWTSYCRLAACLPDQRAPKQKEGSADHDRGH